MKELIAKIREVCDINGGPTLEPLTGADVARSIRIFNEITCTVNASLVLRDNEYFGYYVSRFLILAIGIAIDQGFDIETMINQEVDALVEEFKEEKAKHEHPGTSLVSQETDLPASGDAVASEGDTAASQ